jgi:hypothetical protein
MGPSQSSLYLVSVVPNDCLEVELFLETKTMDQSDGAPSIPPEPVWISRRITGFPESPDFFKLGTWMKEFVVYSTKQCS